MGFEIFLTVLYILLLVNFVILDCKLSKMEKDRLNLDVVAAIVAIEKAVKKLNEKLRYETQSLSDYKQRLKRLEKRIDILEEGHPDTDIDYGTVDDDGNVTEVWFKGKRYVPEDKRNDVDYTQTDGNGNTLAVWFHGKKYVPEDKRDEDTVTFYADGKVAAVETTRPEEKRCCATCQHYRPGSDHTCTIRSWVQVTKARANEAASVCNNYEKMSGNGEVETSIKKIDELQIKIDYIDLLKEQRRVNDKTLDFDKQLRLALQSGIMSVREWREFMEDLDSDT